MLALSFSLIHFRSFVRFFLLASIPENSFLGLERASERAGVFRFERKPQKPFSSTHFFYSFLPSFLFSCCLLIHVKKERGKENRRPSSHSIPDLSLNRRSESKGKRRKRKKAKKEEEGANGAKYFARKRPFAVKASTTLVYSFSLFLGTARAFSLPLSLLWPSFLSSPLARTHGFSLSLAAPSLTSFRFPLSQDPSLLNRAIEAAE